MCRLVTFIGAVDQDFQQPLQGWALMRLQTGFGKSIPMEDLRPFSTSAVAYTQCLCEFLNHPKDAIGITGLLKLALEPAQLEKSGEILGLVSHELAGHAAGVVVVEHHIGGTGALVVTASSQRSTSQIDFAPQRSMPRALSLTASIRNRA